MSESPNTSTKLIESINDTEYLVDAEDESFIKHGKMNDWQDEDDTATVSSNDECAADDDDDGNDDSLQSIIQEESERAANRAKEADEKNAADGALGHSG